MKFKQKIEELREKIIREITPLVKTDYVLLDLPYHSNIGDILIWEGEESFLKTLSSKCLGRFSSDTFYDSELITSETTIFLHGGGNFGDIWPKHQKFRLNVIQQYKQNPIIIFPQTVSYSDVSQIEKEAAKLAEHKKLTICARDQRSFDLLKKYFTNNILMLPDMAFCIDTQILREYDRPIGEKQLFLMRNDKELSHAYNYKQFVGGEENMDVKDWPTKQRGNLMHKVMTRPIHPRFPFKNFTDYYAYNIYRKYLVKKGVSFLSTYKYIYTTRLHGAILSVLLHKPLTFLDNSYGKNKGFYDTWLSELEDVKFL
ncbi:polysaccharide pyruvyl transferase YvfF [Sphingobacterium phlebotomi]|uniref:Polysaccharide pyruvyl transferase YvfF n=1 Tax=Sphingobacterium phlebotomi TaxID=2605433 RepID=A0A5D4H9B5_9SPHI|nr:polysaccharide pyruvyl transferase family protein [Sphingobacterium phlebotomi]TYR36882.1 polysaccharide pyruvyl transferase YvfF [Sphingobacterium phlebotomi]